MSRVSPTSGSTGVRASFDQGPDSPRVPATPDTRLTTPAVFVPVHSPVRRVWGALDATLLVFAGGAAEFALNRAVDWLFFTGRLPADPVGRLLSTVRYAQQIVFSSEPEALAALARIRRIHEGVERARGGTIPAWAHRDVLYMLAGYTERAHELLHGPLDDAERSALWAVFRRVGAGLGIPDLPADYGAWGADRVRHLERDLAYGPHTALLYAAYREHLGRWRYHLLLRAQALLAPPTVRRLLGIEAGPATRLAARGYRALARAGLGPAVQRLLLPPEHLPALRAIEAHGT